MILLIDNYDSFSYNLYQLIGSVEPDIKVIRNDAHTIEEIEAMKPEAIIISPGPGKPEDAGVCIEAIKYFTGKLPIFGVCLGHQAICEAFGGTVSYAKELMHGKQSKVYQGGIRTVFNILGPLSNPAGANMELMGVYDEELVEPLAQVMAKLGVDRGMVVYGQDSLDEISMCAPTSVCEIRDGWFQSYELTPEQFGYKKCDKKELTGGSPEENAEITRAILSGEEQGAKRQAVCLNAGAALYITGKTDTIEAGVRMAEKLIDSGAAAKKLEEFIAESLR